MTVSPDRRLLAALAGWTGAALAVVVWPPLWPALLAALVVLVALVVWDAVLLGRVPPVVMTRQVPPRAFAGRDVEVVIHVNNTGARTLVLDLLDEAPADVAAMEPVFPGVAVEPGSMTSVCYVGRPRLRGDRAFGPLLGLVRSPLGFLRRRETGASGDVLRVYPDASRFLARDALHPRRVFATLGMRPARRRGDGMEFESLRDYVPGDDVRRIDWAATARRRKLVTRLYQHERNHTVVIALDTSRLMGGPTGARTKLDHAVDAALALAYGGLACGDRVGVVAFDRAVGGHLTPRAHRRHLGLFVDFLRLLAPRPCEPDYAALVRDLAARQGKRALIVIFTDFVEADRAVLVAPLVQLARRHRVLLVAIRDHAYTALGADPGGEGEDPLALYRRVVLDELLAERETALARLRQSGLDTADLEPGALTAAVLDRYLTLRRAGGW